jgi:hypothetical protein
MTDGKEIVVDSSPCFDPEIPYSISVDQHLGTFFNQRGWAFDSLPPHDFRPDLLGGKPEIVETLPAPAPKKGKK